MKKLLKFALCAAVVLSIAACSSGGILGGIEGSSQLAEPQVEHHKQGGEDQGANEVADALLTGDLAHEVDQGDDDGGDAGDNDSGQTQDGGDVNPDNPGIINDGGNESNNG